MFTAKTKLVKVATELVHRVVEYPSFGLKMPESLRPRNVTKKIMEACRRPYSCEKKKVLTLNS